MSLPPGTRLGPYEIFAAIGAGGMGEVYRAKDTKLNRDVALKVLPDSFANDADRLARFTREAQTLASLNHPNIASVYGLEEGPVAEGAAEAGRPARALVMELVEGDDLSQRIEGLRAKGLGLSLDEALLIAKQIADALEAAHEQGIIHRDLKPANIKVRSDGTVKVLDFGLAKAIEAGGAGQAGGTGRARDVAQGFSPAGLSHSPTMMPPAQMSGVGVILGTAAYMAPEQARGKTVDKRADIWAFGVVLFEMLTGTRAFKGDDISDVLASVLKDDVRWDALPADVPTPIRRLLRRCLEKDLKRRLSAIADARLEIEEALTAPSAADVGAAQREPAPRSLTSRTLPWAVAGVFGVAWVAALLAWSPWRSAPDRQPARVSVLAPEGATLAFDAAESAISPDGRFIVFTTVDASGASKLWVRSLDALDARALAGSESAYLPFWSPDSRQVAFFADGKLKKIPAAGGTVEIICDAKVGRGGSWGTTDVIVFAPSTSGGLLRVPAGGGDPTPATTLDAARGETGHRFPWFLPDGRHFLFDTLPPKNQNYDLYVGSLDAPTRQAVTTADTAAVYAEPGYLLFSRKNVLVAQRFDAGRLQLSGEPAAIGEAPSSLSGLYSAAPAVSVSTTGTLAYLGDRLPNTKLVWFDRSGRDVGTLAVPDGRYQEIAFSPDGRRAAIMRYTTSRAADIWIADVDRGGASRFTSAPGQNQGVVWSPDGNRVVFSSNRNGPRDFFVKPASGAAPEEILYASTVQFKDPYSWSPDGKFIVFQQADPQPKDDLWLLPLDGDRTPKAYLRTPFAENYGRISPDGRWMMYASDESGRLEIYVDSFPTPRNKYRVTDHGGVSGFWRKDGRELAIVSADARSLFRADVLPGAEFRATSPRQIALPKDTVWVQPTPDFQRLLVSVPVVESRTSSLTVVFDWLGALRKK